MKASDLINELRGLIDKHGDLNVETDFGDIIDTVEYVKNDNVFIVS